MLVVGVVPPLLPSLPPWDTVENVTGPRTFYSDDLDGYGNE